MTKKKTHKSIARNPSFWLIPTILALSVVFILVQASKEHKTFEKSTQSNSSLQNEGSEAMRKSIESSFKHNEEMSTITENCMNEIFNSKVSPSNSNQANSTIMGSLTYASEGIPSQLSVCAFNIGEHSQYCTEKHITDDRFIKGKGYSLNVAPGKYYLYYKLPIDQNIYYAVFGKLGESVDHDVVTPNIVNLQANQVYTPTDTEKWVGWISANGGVFLSCEELI